MNPLELDKRDHSKISEEKISVDTGTLREKINQKKLKITKVQPLVIVAYRTAIHHDLPDSTYDTAKDLGDILINYC